MAKLIFRSSDLCMYLTLALYGLVDLAPGNLDGLLTRVPGMAETFTFLSSIPAPSQGLQLSILCLLLAISLFGHLRAPQSH